MLQNIVSMIQKVNMDFLDHFQGLSRSDFLVLDLVTSNSSSEVVTVSLMILFLLDFGVVGFLGFRF